MKKCLLVLLLAGLCSCSPSTRRAATSHDWSEPADPAGESPAAAWSAVEGFNVSFGSIDARYPRSQPFAGEIVREHNLVGWKGEKLSAQAVVWTSAEVKDLECKVGNFVSADGAKLKDIARARFVKYVLSDQFNRKKPCGPRQPGEPSHLSADMLDEVATLTVPAKTARPVWITVEVPRGAKAGRYRADVEIKGADLKPRKLTLNLEVTGRTLPKPSEWAYHLDLWQHPTAVARVQGVEVWSDEHFRLMKPLMQMLADAGQKVITTNVNKEPWNNQCYDAYADMIIWTKHPDGTWEYDFKAFDRWVEFMMGLGVNKMINCYSMLPWNNMLHYKDAATGKFVDVKADPGTPNFAKCGRHFCPHSKSTCGKKAG
nr:glycoside hydrolase domain-containing protein [Ereboglobus luteus]